MIRLISKLLLIAFVAVALPSGRCSIITVDNFTALSDGPMTQDFQPNIITVESYPARKVFGSLSDSHGSLFCDGNVTFWMVGHQPEDETPWCLSSPATAVTVPGTNDTFIDYTHSVWTQPFLATLDEIDPRNDNDGDRHIDRHDDIICGVGANKGSGIGYTELYLGTMEDGNSTTNRVKKVAHGRGLQKHPTTRTRFVRALRSADGSDLIFIAARGATRVDGQENVHRMYRNVAPANASRSQHNFYYEEVPGPWRRNSQASCLITQDFNGDGLDDIILCNQRSRALIYLQNPDSSWTAIPTKGKTTKYWRSARLADFTGDGILDLVVVSWGASPANPNEASYVRIFAGQSSFPYLDLGRKPILDKALLFATPDVEVLDVNSDGSPDIYIPLADELTLDTYCADVFNNRLWWEKGNQPPPNWTPPIDHVADLLILGKTGNGTYLAEHFIDMDHAEPGCGWMVERFGNDRTMILAQGTGNRPGHNMILQWAV
jgi:FG-GAP-like repeat